MVRNYGIGVKKRLNPLNDFKKCAEIQIHFIQIFSAFQRKIMQDFCAEKFEKSARLSSF